MGAKRKRTDGHGASHAKLDPLPHGYKLEKRPLLHPAIPSRFASASTPKVVYISGKTPFMSAVKRVTKLLDGAEQREAQSALASTRPRNSKGKDADLDEAARILATRPHRSDASGEVVLKGTGCAIEKTLGLALFFKQRAGYKITIRTASVGTIDDIVSNEESQDIGGTLEVDAPVTFGEDGSAANGHEAEATVMPLSRMRYTSVVEAWVSRTS